MRLTGLPRVESTVSSILTLGIFQTLAAVLLIAGLVNRERELLLLSAFLLASVNVARVWARLAARRLTFTAAVSRSRLYPGEELVLSVRAENRKLLPVWVRAEIPAGPERPIVPAGEGGPGGGAWLEDRPSWPAPPRRTTPPTKPFAMRGGSAGTVSSAAVRSSGCASATGTAGVEAGGAGGPSTTEPGLLLEGETGLTAFQQVEWTRTLEAPRRGAYLLGPLRLQAGDLLGFFRRREENPVRLEVLVYPRIVSLAPLPLALREFFGLERARMPVEDPAYQVGTRDYQGSRPSRHINWKASARLSTLKEKLFEPTAQVRVLFILDAASFHVERLPDVGGWGSPRWTHGNGSSAPQALAGTIDEEAALAAARSRAADSFERTIEVVASLAARLEQARVPIGLAVNGTLHGSTTAILPPCRGSYQLAEILELLSRLSSRPGREGTGLTAEALKLTGTTTCVYALRAISSSTGPRLAALRSGRRTPLVLLTAEAPGEGAEPSSQGGGPLPPGITVIETGSLRPEREDGRG